MSCAGTTACNGRYRSDGKEPRPTYCKVNDDGSTDASLQIVFGQCWTFYHDGIVGPGVERGRVFYSHKDKDAKRPSETKFRHIGNAWMASSCPLAS